MNAGLVSVMMPAYNAETYIGQAIESVLAQSYPHWELVIVDDGSNDGTSRVVSQYGDPRIRMTHQANQGEASARNTALRNIQGEFLAFLDADDLYLPHHLEVSVGYLIAHDHADGVYSDGFYIDHAGNRLQTLSSRRRGPFEGNLFEEAVFASDVFGPPACVVLRTSLIMQHELKFDENITIGPDWDFFIRFAEAAHFGYLDQITCLYRLHTNNISLRTGLEKRALELAKCRMKAIRTRGFRNCSLSVKTGVFYDLLVELLIDYPEKQSEIVEWPEFIELPKKERAGLFRLMAGSTMTYGKDLTHVITWLNRSRQLNPADWRTDFSWFLFQIHPLLFKIFLKIKHSKEVDPRTIPPFTDIKLHQS